VTKLAWIAPISSWMSSKRSCLEAFTMSRN
jgi:hypothetical protein